MQVVTLAVLIGNSDDKLSQAEWSRFCEAVDGAFENWASRVHFAGYSVPGSRWQNACFVGEFFEGYAAGLRVELARIAAVFRQDSIAVLPGGVEFVSAEKPAPVREVCGCGGLCDSGQPCPMARREGGAS